MALKKRTKIALASIFLSFIFVYLLGVTSTLNESGDKSWYILIAIDLIVLALLSEILYRVLMPLFTGDVGDTPSAKERTKEVVELKKEKKVIDIMENQEKKRQEEWEELQKQYKG